MGFDVQRFVDVVDDEYFCSICLMVFENPVHGPCGHTFCSVCIENWIPLNVNACPLDKKPLYKKDLTQVSLPFRNLLTRLRIKCDFEVEGCKFICQMGLLPEHVKMCPFNPNGEMICDQGCDLTFLRKERDTHKCIDALKELVAKQRIEIADLKRTPKRTHDGNLRTALDASPSMGYYNRSAAGISDLLSISDHRDLIRFRRFRPDTRARTPPPRADVAVGSSATDTSSGTISSHSAHRLSALTPTELLRQRSAAPRGFDQDRMSVNDNLTNWLSLPDVEVRVPRLTEDDIAHYSRSDLRGGGLRGGASSSVAAPRAVGPLTNATSSSSSSSSQSSSQSSSPSQNSVSGSPSSLIGHLRADPMLSSTTPDSSRPGPSSSTSGVVNSPSSSTGPRNHDLLSQMLSSRSSHGCGSSRSLTDGGI